MGADLAQACLGGKPWLARCEHRDGKVDQAKQRFVAELAGKMLECRAEVAPAQLAVAGAKVMLSEKHRILARGNHRRVRVQASASAERARISPPWLARGQVVIPSG